MMMQWIVNILSDQSAVCRVFTLHFSIPQLAWNLEVRWYEKNYLEAGTGTTFLQWKTKQSRAKGPPLRLAWFEGVSDPASRLASFMTRFHCEVTSKGSEGLDYKRAVFKQFRAEFSVGDGNSLRAGLLDFFTFQTCYMHKKDI